MVFLAKFLRFNSSVYIFSISTVLLFKSIDINRVEEGCVYIHVSCNKKLTLLYELPTLGVIFYRYMYHHFYVCKLLAHVHIVEVHYQFHNEFY